MKPASSFLIGSLIANGALVAAIALRPVSSVPVARDTKQTTTTVAARAPAAAAPAPKPVAIPLWSRLQTKNLDDLVAHLRAAGFPPKEIRTIVSTSLGEQQMALREEIVGKADDVPYWKNPYNYDNREQQTRLSEMYRESSKLYYKYGGGPEALADDEDAQIYAKRRFGNLPLGKLQQLTALEHDAEDTQMQLSMTYFNGTARSPEDLQKGREAMLAFEKEKAAQVAAILTPAELEQYELRNNGAALANQLTAFRPTEDEFKAIYALEKANRAAQTDPGFGAVGPLPRGAESKAAYEAQVVAALGADRAADYLALRTAGGMGDKLPLLIARLELPLTTMTTINNVRTDINSRARAIAENSQLTPDQRNSQLATLAGEAKEKLTNTLGGQRGYNAYLDVKGDWIRELQNKRK